MLKLITVSGHKKTIHRRKRRQRYTEVELKLLQDAQLAQFPTSGSSDCTQLQTAQLSRLLQIESVSTRRCWALLYLLKHDSTSAPSLAMLSAT